MELNFALHTKQLEVFQSDARFRVVAAGRRFGKTFLSCVELLLNGLQDVNEHGMSTKMHEVWYIAPTYGQAKKIMWKMLLELGKDVIVKKWENDTVVELINGRTIRLLGSDKPDTLRGSAVGFVVLDEFASMKPEVWDLIVRPALADTKGSALFIGTPDGLNHFYEIWLQGNNANFPQWESFLYHSVDNPLIDDTELKEAALTMTKEAYEQEFEASFAAAGGGDLVTSDSIYLPSSPQPGQIVMTVDPAGYGSSQGLTKSKLSKLDETAISICEVSTAGWFYHEVIHGRWEIRETSLKIVRAAQKYQPSKVGIEKGALKNAIMPYISDQQRRLHTYFNIEPLSHGGKAKTDRIMWSLQGRLQNGRIMMKENQPWNKAVEQQMNDFPNPLAHDDLIDSMAYVDQIATASYDFASMIIDDEDWDNIYQEW